MANWGRWFDWGERAKPLEEERRGWLRVSCNVPTLLHRAADASAPTLPARVHNISPGGVSLVAEGSFELGQMLSMVLPHPDREPPTTVLVCVVRVEDLGDGRRQLGCTFSAEITEADLALFAPPNPSRTPEQRAWTRYPSQAHATYQRVNTPTAAASVARVLNLSINGVALQADAPIEVGELLNVELRDDAGRQIVSILACVVRVTGRAGDDWLFGCNFMSEITEAQMRALV